MGVKLPPEYQETEYIECDGNEYIDTGYYVKSENVRIIISCFTASSFYEYDFIGNLGGSTGRFVFGSVNIGFFLYARDGIGSETNLTYQSDYVQRYYLFDATYNLEAGIKSLSVNGITASNSHTRSVMSTHSVQVFADGNGTHRRPSGKYYHVALYDAGVLAFDLIPCYRKSDNKTGMYDLVSGGFFTSQGTGEFAVGPDVIDSISPWLVARRMGIVSQLARMNNPPDGAIFWNGVNCEDVQDGFSYYYKTGGGASSNIRITVENGALVIYKPTSANFDCQPRGDDIGLTGKHTVSVVCKISRPLSAGNDQLLFGITSGLNRTTRIVEKDITSDVTAEYKTFSVNFQSDESGWPFIRATGSSGKDPYSVIVKEWVIS